MVQSTYDPTQRRTTMSLSSHLQELKKKKLMIKEEITRLSTH